MRKLQANLLRAYLVARYRAEAYPLLPAFLVLGAVLLVGDWAWANTNPPNNASIANDVSTEIQNQLKSIICPLANLLSGPVARFISLAIFVGAVIYYLSNDSRTAKGLALAAVVGLILANTFPQWQALFTNQTYDQLCQGYRRN